MGKKNIVLAGYVIFGILIGLKAMVFYGRTVGDSLFFKAICLLLAIVIAFLVGKTLRESTVTSILIFVVAFLLRRPLSWLILWAVSLIEVVLMVFVGVIGMLWHLLICLF